MDLQIIDRIEVLEQYSNDWQQILKSNKNDNTYIELEWILNWWHFFAQGHRLFVVRLSENGQSIAFCPFMITQKKCFYEINFIGHGLAAYMDFIIMPDKREQAVDCILQFLLNLKGNYFVNLYGMFENSPDHAIFIRYLEKSSVRFYISSTRCYYIDICNRQFKDYFVSRFGSNSRQCISRKERRLEVLGNLIFKQNDIQCIEEMFKLHEKRWSLMLGIKDFSRGITKEFFKSFILNKNTSFNTFINTLRLNNRLIAFVYCYECNGRTTIYRIAHDDDFNIFSPGEIIYKKTVEAIFNKSANKIDFGGGYEPYKTKWTDYVVNVQAVMFPVRGIIAKLVFICLCLEKGVKNKLKNRWAAIHFKRHILGKIMYCFTDQFVTAKFAKFKRIFIANGFGGITDATLCFLFKRFCTIKNYRLMHKSIEEDTFASACINTSADASADTQSIYTVHIATVDNLNELSYIMGLKPSDIIRRFLGGSKCFFIKSDNQIVSCFWIGFSMNQWYAKCFAAISGACCAFIYDCFCDRRYECEHVYTCIIRYTHEWLAAMHYTDCYAFISKRNIAMFNALKKARFEKKASVRIIRFLGKLYYHCKHIKGKNYEA